MAAHRSSNVCHREEWIGHKSRRVFWRLQRFLVGLKQCSHELFINSEIWSAVTNRGINNGIF